jgi:phosphoribosylformimino-5-aminoimidazole carboxamide ribotide isomerase
VFIIPVLDLKAGVVVRGVGGRRAEYRPVVSRLTSSAAPADVAEGFRRHFGLSLLYLADLDAISGRPPALATYRDLQARGFQLWIDAGIRDVRQVLSLAEVGIAALVVGLETVRGPEILREILGQVAVDRVVFSLDLKDGRPLGNLAPWQQADAAGIAAQAVAAGVRQLLVLDLARVGTGDGTGTEEFCRRLASAHPHVELIAGGGVRGVSDLGRLAACGVRAALVASALHDGRLTADDLRHAGSTVESPAPRR